MSDMPVSSPPPYHASESVPEKERGGYSHVITNETSELTLIYIQQKYVFEHTS